MYEQSLRDTEQEFLIIYGVSNSYVKSCMITVFVFKECLRILLFCGHVWEVWIHTHGYVWITL